MSMQNTSDIGQSILTLNGGARVILDEPQDVSVKLYSLIDEFKSKVLLLPDHQREFVWNDDKVKAWIDRLALATQERPRKPVGVIVTYQINDGKPSPKFINDGSQRIRASEQVLDNPGAYGYDAETVRAILNGIIIPVQHRWYTSQDEALQDFQLLNMGTSLTVREMCKGILSNHPQYRTVWQALFEKVRDAMHTTAGGLVSGRRELNREQRHKLERHDFVLIVRWLSGESGFVDRRSVAAQKLNTGQLAANQVIESELRRLCESRNPTELRREIDLLVQHIYRESAIIRDVWESIRPQAGSALSPTNFRWLIEVSIWKRMSGVSVEEWEKFLRLELTHTKGAAVIQNPNDIRDRVTLGLGALGALHRVCKIIGSQLYEGKPSRFRDRTPILAGFDHSHIKPFVSHGNGPTIPEPASKNRARGAQEIPDA